MSKVKITQWDGCYDSSWKGVITDASFAHPAKFARGLIERIFDYCLERGYLRKGDVVGDCFGGIGTGGITAAYRGLNWVGCELEPKFVALAESNFNLHAYKLFALGCPPPRIIHGDSRKFSEAVSGIVSSPPYADTDGHPSMGHPEKHGLVGGDILNRCTTGARAGDEKYGQTDGQIGRLKAGEVDGVISSPPFLSAISSTTDSSGGIMRDGYEGKHRCDPSVGDRTWKNGDAREPGNIETLKEGSVSGVISSPPYSDIAAGAGGLNTKPAKHAGQQSGRSASAASQDTDQKYGVVTSSEGKKPTARARGKIGKEKGQTYWEAMLQVYQSCFLAIKPGGVIVLVLKNYVKDRKVVPLCDDTVRLLEHIGFVTVERIRAMLKVKTVHNDLFHKEGVTTVKSRASFFRRLAEKKGSPPIDWEEVIICQRPNDLSQAAPPAEGR